ncbi:hypothetical protein [Halomonas sp. H5]|uniref:hypothetical protein n=1 Tax=Halomonas sp. H5 TaxID=3423910 RepID=UPI003D36352A
MNHLKLPLAALLLVAALVTGWTARGWLEDSQRLTAERAAQQAIDAALARESRIAHAVEARLAELDANERIIDRGIIREVQKPIYQRVCLGDDAIRLLNDAAAGRRPDPAGPAAPLPRDPAGAD